MAQPGPEYISPEEVQLALRLKTLRQRMIKTIGTVSSCKTCAKHVPPPRGHWSGGYCCGGEITAENFSNDELDALRASGTFPTDFVAPRGAQAGCAFRGPKGCYLQPEHRPLVCVIAFCDELTEELICEGQWDNCLEIMDEIIEIFNNFVDLRVTRIENERFYL